MKKKSNDPQIKFWGRGQGLEPGTRAKSGCRQWRLSVGKNKYVTFRLYIIGFPTSVLLSSEKECFLFFFNCTNVMHKRVQLKRFYMAPFESSFSTDHLFIKFIVFKAFL